MECKHKNRSLLGIQDECRRNEQELKIIERLFAIAKPRLVYRWKSKMESEDVFEENWLYLLFIDCECGEEHPVIAYETIMDQVLKLPELYYLYGEPVDIYDKLQVFHHKFVGLRMYCSFVKVDECRPIVSTENIREWH
jgi:hypothetical protein